MIRCDLCNKIKDKEHINTIIIHKQKLDYCNSKRCKNKIRTNSQTMEKNTKV